MNQGAQLPLQGEGHQKLQSPEAVSTKGRTRTRKEQQHLPQASKPRPKMVLGARREHQVSFFFFVSRRASKAECNAKSPILRTRNIDTRRQNCTTPDCTLHVNMPQDGCTSTPKVAGVMSPATPYRNTRQNKQIQGKTAQQDKLKDARDTI